MTQLPPPRRPSRVVDRGEAGELPQSPDGGRRSHRHRRWRSSSPPSHTTEHHLCSLGRGGLVQVHHSGGPGGDPRHDGGRRPPRQIWRGFGRGEGGGHAPSLEEEEEPQLVVALPEPPSAATLLEPPGAPVVDPCHVRRRRRHRGMRG